MASGTQASVFCSQSCKHGRVGDTAGDMIQCANCENWFHKDCLRISRGSKILGIWVCSNCDGVIRTHGNLLRNLEAVLKDHTSSLLDLTSQVQKLSTQQQRYDQNSWYQALSPNVVPSGLPMGTSPDTGRLQSAPSYASKVSTGIPMGNTMCPHTIPDPSQAAQTTIPTSRPPPQRIATQQKASKEKASKPQMKVIKGTKQQDSPLTNNIQTELFHVSYLSKATNPSHLKSYCELKGLKVVATEETSKHKKLPWRCFRLRIVCSAQEEVLKPTLWPSGTSCSLSVPRRHKDSPEIWGTDPSTDALSLAYSPMCEVYVGNCSLEADASDLQTWIVDGGVQGTIVTDLPISPRSHTKSFRVTANHSEAASLLDAAFWPDGTVFRGFRLSADTPQPVSFNQQPRPTRQETVTTTLGGVEF